MSILRYSVYFKGETTDFIEWAKRELNPFRFYSVTFTEIIFHMEK